ncbi:MAG: sigma-70 family RNA polymerase sigma factor [Oscillospiraceae bacterium]|jgi:RNA polymerase sporulation-specific sigma factor|nr:sigma-70 family RNA polymerase sigma factor [Oscillospiraceae bacterium]
MITADTEVLVTENSGLIWSIARRFFGRGTDPDDLYQIGCLGLIKAARDFDPEYGTKFSTYAVPKISGEIQRFLRDDGTVKVSRSVKEKSYKIARAKSELEQTLGRSPALSELSEATGYSPEELAVCENASAAVDSLQRELGQDGDGFDLANTLADFTAEDKMLEQVALRDAISKLPDKERQVIVLRYWRGLTQANAAKVMNVSQVQISRLEKRAVTILRSFLSS